LPILALNNAVHPTHECPIVQVTVIAGIRYSSGDTEGYPGTSELNDPYGLCLAGDFIYVAEYANARIKRLNLTDNYLSIYAGTGDSASTDGQSIVFLCAVAY
jgi:hypothetical protein